MSGKWQLEVVCLEDEKQREAHPICTILLKNRKFKAIVQRGLSLHRYLRVDSVSRKDKSTLTPRAFHWIC